MRKYIILICLLGSIYLTSCSCSFSIDHERQEHVTITNADDENSGQYNSPQNTSQKEEDDNNADDETNTDEDLNQSENQQKTTIFKTEIIKPPSPIIIQTREPIQPIPSL